MKKNTSKKLRKIMASVVAALVLNGCGDSENFVFTDSGINAPNAPVANNDVVTALGNSTLSQLAVNGVLGNDVRNGAEISSFTDTSVNGATVNVNADGSFTYTPVFGFTGADSFTYTLANEAGESTATVTVNVNNKGFFVDNSGANGNGSQATPFNNLAAALAAAGDGDTVFVYRGDGTSTNLSGAINLPAGVKLVGQGAGLVLAQQIEPAGQRPVITGPITLGGRNTVSGFSISGSASDAVWANGVQSVVVDNNVFTGSNGHHIRFSNVSGNTVVSNNVFNPNSLVEVDYVSIENTDTNGGFTFSSNDFLANDAVPKREALRFDCNGTSSASLVANNNRILCDVGSEAFSDGIILYANLGASLAVTLTGNEFVRCGADSIDINVSGEAEVTGTISANTVEASGDNGFEVDAGSDSIVELVISDNILTDTDSDAIDLDAQGMGQLTATLVGNEIVSAGGNGITSDVEDNAIVRLALRNNVITDSGLSSVVVDCFGSGDVGLDITGNTVNRDMTFNFVSGTFGIERFAPAEGGPLTSVNTFNAAAGVVTLDLDILSRVAGFYTIP